MEMQGLSNNQLLPHIVQVIHISHPSLQVSGNVTYQTITAPALNVSQVSHHGTVAQETQNQQLQSLQNCSEILPGNHNENLQNVAQTYTHEAPIIDHVYLQQPTGYSYKQMVQDNVPSQSGNYGGQYEKVYEMNNSKTAHIRAAKQEPEELTAVENKTFEGYSSKKTAAKSELPSDELLQTKKKRNRSPLPNPSKWACNVRKLKHQRGEAYISRRGKFVPERKVKTTKDCLQTCKYKCSTVVSDSDREHLFKSFYSLSANEKKHFLLNTTERCEVKTPRKVSARRKYNFKYFFLVKAVRYTVCKNFYLGTLAISQKPVYNVHSGKNDWNIPKPDGRGQSEASAHSLPSEIKDRVRKHIMTFKTLDFKPLECSRLKKQYIAGAMNVKQMYKMYQDQCNLDRIESVKESMYRKILKNEFNVHFKKVKVEGQLCSKCKGPVKNK